MRVVFSPPGVKRQRIRAAVEEKRPSVLQLQPVWMLCVCASERTQPTGAPLLSTAHSARGECQLPPFATSYSNLIVNQQRYEPSITAESLNHDSIIVKARATVESKINLLSHEHGRRRDYYFKKVTVPGEFDSQSKSHNGYYFNSFIVLTYNEAQKKRTKL